MGKEKKLKAFMVSYCYHEAHSEGNESVVRNITIVVQKLHKTKANKSFFTQEYYEKQNMFVYNHEEYNRLYRSAGFKEVWYK